MSANDAKGSAAPADPVVKLRRSTIDKLLVGVGVVATVVFLLAGVLLQWGANFSNDYVHDELSSQQIFFPPEEALREEGRDDLVRYAGQQVTTGKQAEAYASFIQGHLDATADGLTYSQIPDREAREAVAAAEEAGASEEEVAELQAEADKLSAQRDTLFRGETLRGLLLSSYAWATIGEIAGLAAVVAFVASALMAVLVVLGVIQVVRIQKAAAVH